MAQLRLHDAPVIPRRDVPQHRAETSGPVFEAAVQNPDIGVPGEGLSLVEVVDRQEGIVGEPAADPGSLQTPRQPVVSVEADLETERRPGRHAHVAQSEPLIDEVEVVVQ